MSDGLSRGERSDVLIKENDDVEWENATDEDLREVEVFDHISIQMNHYVNSVNGYETFEPNIAKGDMGVGPEPEAVTKRVADLLWSEFTIKIEDLGIEVVNMSDDNVMER